MISIRLFPEFAEELSRELNTGADLSEGIECFDPRLGERITSANPALMLAEIMVRSGRVLDDEAWERIMDLANYCSSDVATAKGVTPYDGSGYLVVPITGGDFQALLEPEHR